ncbi:MAG: hypothetical protein ABSH53_22120 [Holophaga sp.]
MDKIKQGAPWLGLSWKHYLWWFADFEARVTESTARRVIKKADNQWKQLERIPVYMEERPNDGSWVRQWLIAENEFRKLIEILS